MCNECKFVVFFVVLGFSMHGFEARSVGHKVESGWRYGKMRIFF